MSTRSVVGVITEKGRIGRYVHSDGYPEGRLPNLSAIIRKFGATEAAKIVMELGDQGGWSYLSPDYTDNRLGADRAVVVPGVGLAYRDAPKNARGYDYTDEEARQDFGIEYRYYIDTVTGEIEWYEGESTEPQRHATLLAIRQDGEPAEIFDAEGNRV